MYHFIPYVRLMALLLSLSLTSSPSPPTAKLHTGAVPLIKVVSSPLRTSTAVMMRPTAESRTGQDIAPRAVLPLRFGTGERGAMAPTQRRWPLVTIKIFSAAPLARLYLAAYRTRGARNRCKVRSRT